ncbi:MAG TPA: amino acid adenylation domain-containing protein, partial [Thermoanaerobaculia bacterium]
MHALFEAQAARTPNRVALQFENETLTYRELNARANHIARRLRSLGVREETLVAILMDRSLDLLAALLGILKAGGAYVPLDPMYPVDRLEFMLEDSHAPVLVTQSSLASLLRTSATIFEVDRDLEGDERNVASSVRDENLAYVIYTSGSTGKPKGVQIPHRALINFLDSMREAPGLSEHDTIFAVTTLSFDIAGLELWLPLTTGARIELVSREIAADGRRLAEKLSRSDATVIQATPATYRMLIEAGWKGDPRLKILCGGEAMPRDLADALLTRCESLWNMYGPTETTIWSTIHRVTSDIASVNVPIGKPIANTQVYVLDANLQPAPEGELFIGGDGVARGYLNRASLTAQRFVPDPFGAPGARMYRTGDAVRLLSDGSIEYLERLDHQVKVRGYRIELGEIENALRKQDGVANAVVIARDDLPGGKALVAYCIARGTLPSAAALREHLRATLPEYMVPSHFATLDAFPLTPNGKIDRKALPAPARTSRDDDESYVAPR